MNSRDYRVIIKRISLNLLKKRFPGLDKKLICEVATDIARNVHARMYGANVDGVDSPIWADQNHIPPKPLVNAAQLLKESENEKVLCHCRIACYACYGATA